MKIGIHGAAWSNHFGSDTLYIIDSCKRIGLDYLEIPFGTDLSEIPVQEVVDRCDGALEIKNGNRPSVSRSMTYPRTIRTAANRLFSI